MKKKYASLVLAAMLTLGGTGLANASNAIYYTATDLTDLTLGEDLWQYTYTVTGDSFAAGTGFVIDFENDLFVFTESDPTPLNGDWEVSTHANYYADPEFPITVYDAYAMNNNASLANQFSVAFVWKGGNEVPGAQLFRVYDQNEGTVLQHGETAPVPVPGTVMLLGSALAALSAVGRRKKN